MALFAYLCNMKYDIVIFDLDGTLLNTIGDLAAAVDYVMRSRQLPEHTDAEYRQMVGGGIKRLVERALNDTEVKYTPCLQDILEADAAARAVVRRAVGTK